MKIQQSRNQREGRYCGHLFGSHRRGGKAPWNPRYPRNDRDCHMTRKQRKRDKMLPADNDYSGCWPDYTSNL